MNSYLFYVCRSSGSFIFISHVRILIKISECSDAEARRNGRFHQIYKQKRPKYLVYHNSAPPQGQFLYQNYPSPQIAWEPENCLECQGRSVNPNVQRVKTDFCGLLGRIAKTPVKMADRGCGAISRGCMNSTTAVLNTCDIGLNSCVKAAENGCHTAEKRVYSKLDRCDARISSYRQASSHKHVETTGPACPHGRPLVMKHLPTVSAYQPVATPIPLHHMQPQPFYHQAMHFPTDSAAGEFSALPPSTRISGSAYRH